MKKNNGGPAFPKEYEGSGMTLHDYFVAHAPAEPQPWFQPEMPKKPMPLLMPNDFTPEERADYRSWQEERIDLEHMQYARSQEFAEADSERTEQRAAWDREREKQRWVQWPAAWADEQIALRARREGA